MAETIAPLRCPIATMPASRPTARETAAAEPPERLPRVPARQAKCAGKVAPLAEPVTHPAARGRTPPRIGRPLPRRRHRPQRTATGLQQPPYPKTLRGRRRTALGRARQVREDPALGREEAQRLDELGRLVAPRPSASRSVFGSWRAMAGACRARRGPTARAAPRRLRAWRRARGWRARTEGDDGAVAGPDERHRLAHRRRFLGRPASCRGRSPARGSLLRWPRRSYIKTRWRAAERRRGRGAVTKSRGCRRGGHAASRPGEPRLLSSCTWSAMPFLLVTGMKR